MTGEGKKEGKKGGREGRERGGRGRREGKRKRGKNAVGREEIGKRPPALWDAGALRTPPSDAPER